jgi:hypothetical protein
MEKVLIQLPKLEQLRTYHRLEQPDKRTCNIAFFEVRSPADNQTPHLESSRNKMK